MSFIAITEQAANGLIISSLYALIALGIALIFGVLRIVNFAHGEFYMLGGYACYLAVTLLGLPPVFGVLAGVIVLLLVGAGVERTLIRPIHQGRIDRPDEYAIMITFALSVLLLNLMNSAFGPWPQRPQALISGVVEIGPVLIPGDRLAAALMGSAIILAFMAVLRWSWIGMAVRAVSQDRSAAQAFGINIDRVSTAAFAAGAGLAGAAGALIGPVFNVVPAMGVVPSIKAYVIVVLGGLGSIRGALLGALILGQVESFAPMLIPDPSRGMAYRDAYGLVVLVLVLLIRPQGLFGRKERRA
ncbi:branched-chain amino acid ABC transporter permease [Pseudogemmobacter faecipullorum]|uniref:Branched-chain amino acid ABC transporter permease n=1 Tax=Pseudogemmobacter faecipullorum TaxID=2755041 RepID=A0ABS8CNH2_9RHOB|nr:branched-chain amino acid ABC transporter permease [Pseudogemmobacter faecipullorum]MCB5410957.1 branched-chain amino acid ABC transporter permease [Pseudogemmobacter faecipullorum]